jgi:hypothetical protein
MSQPMDYTTTPPTPITIENARAAAAELSQKAQAAELRGDHLLADVLHQGLNQELDHIKQLEEK